MMNMMMMMIMMMMIMMMMTKNEGHITCYHDNHSPLALQSTQVSLPGNLCTWLTILCLNCIKEIKQSLRIFFSFSHLPLEGAFCPEGIFLSPAYEFFNFSNISVFELFCVAQFFCFLPYAISLFSAPHKNVPNDGPSNNITMTLPL